MANKYQKRRRLLRDTQSRAEGYALFRTGSPGEPASRYQPPPPIGRHAATVGVCLMLVAGIILLYAQTARHSFTVCDDNDYIYKNPNVIQGLNWRGIRWAWDDAHAGNWHPLTWMSHMLDWQVFGRWERENQRYVESWPGGHHLVSMFIHCGNAVLLFLALRMMTGTIWPAAIVAGLFALHPLRVESVAWAAERKDVLCGFFWMASMLAYAYYVRRRPILQAGLSEILATIAIYLLVTLLFGLALVAKSMAVTLPCALLLLDFWPLNRWQKALWPPGRPTADGPNYFAASWLVIEKLPWFAMVVYDCLQTVVGQDKGVALNSFEGLPLVPRLINSLVSIAAYLGQFFVPHGMAPFYPHPHMLPPETGWTMAIYVQAAIGGMLLAGITFAVVWLWRKSYLAVGWFWFLGVMIPVIGILQVGTQARADRYTYLPMIGVYLMVVWLLKEAADGWPSIRLPLAGLAAVVFAVLGAITFQQVSYWRNSYTLFQHAVEVTDNNWFAFNHLGIQYDEDGLWLLANGNRTDLPLTPSADFALKKWGKERTDPGVGQFLLDRSADNFKGSIDVKPDYDFGNNNLGVYYARKEGKQDLELAEKYFRKALTSNVRYADAYNNLGIVLARQGKLREAVASHQAGLKVRPDRDTDHNNLSRAYLQLEELDNAVKENELALYYNPNCVPAWAMRVELFTLLRQYDKVVQSLKRIENIDPAAPQGMDARFRLERLALVLSKPDAPESLTARLEMSELSLRQSRLNEAIHWAGEVLARKPDAPQAYFLRGEAYRFKGDLPRAKADIEQVLKLEPGNAVIVQKLNEIQAQMANPN